MDGHARSPSRLDLLKALGDNTRYAIYLELARSPRPLATADVAESLDLHPNTVRPHLERMRDVGLLVVETEGRGGVGRPQHRYSVAPDAPSLGLEPPAMPLMAGMLVGVAAASGAAAEEAAAIGRRQGRAAAAELVAATGGAGDGIDAEVCLEALVADLTRLGFDPAAVADADGTTVAFTHCPYADLASAHPEIICHLHRGMVEGFLEAAGGLDVSVFRTLIDRQPCRVELVAAPGQR
ncbi:MAG: helix-turn-helix domain-containing protein [Acidimicrobiales bacterium]